MVRPIHHALGSHSSVVSEELQSWLETWATDPWQTGGDHLGDLVSAVAQTQLSATVDGHGKQGSWLLPTILENQLALEQASALVSRDSFNFGHLQDHTDPWLDSQASNHAASKASGGTGGLTFNPLNGKNTPPPGGFFLSHPWSDSKKTTGRRAS